MSLAFMESGFGSFVCLTLFGLKHWCEREPQFSGVDNSGEGVGDAISAFDCFLLFSFFLNLCANYCFIDYLRESQKFKNITKTIKN